MIFVLFIIIILFMSALIFRKNLPLFTPLDKNKDHHHHHYHMLDLSTQYYHNLKSLYCHDISFLLSNHRPYY